VGDIKDRLTVLISGYYDQAGYAENVLADRTVYPFAIPVNVITPFGNTLYTSGTKQNWLDYSQAYQTNYLSRSYAALYTAFSRFLLTDMTLGANYIHNLVDHSGLVSITLNYQELNSFTAGLLVNRYLGSLESEYGFQGQLADIQLTLGISF
jgi:hypothetical protein